MKEFLLIFLIIISTFGASFFLLNIRHVFTGKEFRGTCATNNPMVKDKFGNCTVCGKKPNGDCNNIDIPADSKTINH